MNGTVLPLHDFIKDAYHRVIHCTDRRDGEKPAGAPVAGNAGTPSLDFSPAVRCMRSKDELEVRLGGTRRCTPGRGVATLWGKELQASDGRFKHSFPDGSECVTNMGRKGFAQQRRAAQATAKRFFQGYTWA